MKRAYSVRNVMDASFRTIEFDGEWREAVGCPELAGSWFVYGPPKNGKTTFTLQLAKYLCRFRRVAYDSIEEGLSLSMQMAMDRVNMREAGSRLVLLDREPVEELAERLRRRKSPDIVVLDSVQFMELTFGDYKRLKLQFPNKLFIYISHMKGNSPDGNTARRILRDANVTFRVEGYRAFVKSRYGSEGTIDVWREGAARYWGQI